MISIKIRFIQDRKHTKERENIKRIALHITANNGYDSNRRKRKRLISWDRVC